MGRSSLWLACGALGVAAVVACSSKTETPAGQDSFASASGGPTSTSGTGGKKTESNPGGGTEDPGNPSSAPRLVTVTSETMEFGGKTRKYILAIPKSLDTSKSYPLVLS